MSQRAPAAQTHVQRSKLSRYAFLAGWFFLVPLGLALVTVWIASPGETGVGSGFLWTLRLFVEDQPIPAVIVLFTFYEMLFYYFRHNLPGSDSIGVGGRTDLPSEVRREYEAAAHLLDEAARIQEKKKRAVERHVPKSVRDDLDASLDDLRHAMNTEEFDRTEFEKSFDDATAQVERHLGRWRKSEFREYAESILVAVLVALFLRAFVVEAFKIPSGSMLPTLQLQDHIFVNKFKYGPLVPRTKTRILESMPPTRGDVIVFETPDPPPGVEHQDFIKRTIAVPGDTLMVENGHPVINNWRVPNCEVGDYTFRESEDSAEVCVELFVEYLGPSAYLTQYNVDCPEPDGSRERRSRTSKTGREGPYVVKPGEVWVLGDNRDNSSDSRRWFGYRGGGVPFANIKGRAMFVWFSPRLDRLLVDVMGRPRLPVGAPPNIVEKIDTCMKNRPPLEQTSPPSAP